MGKSMKEPVSEAYKTFNKAIDKVLKEPVGPQRWAAAYNLWLTLSPGNSRIAAEVAQENKLFREANSAVGNKFGKVADKNSSMRNFMTLPSGLYYTIERADPEAFKKESNAQKMRKTFPQFTRSEVY